MLSGGGEVPRELALQQFSNFLERRGWMTELGVPMRRQLP